VEMNLNFTHTTELRYALPIRIRLRTPRAQTPDRKKGHHEPLLFAFYHYISIEVQVL